MINFKIKDLMISVYPQSANPGMHYNMVCNNATAPDCNKTSNCQGPSDCNKTSNCQGASSPDCYAVSCKGGTACTGASMGGGDCNVRSACQSATMGEAYFDAYEHKTHRETIMAAGLLNLKQALAGMQAGR